MDVDVALLPMVLRMDAVGSETHHGEGDVSNVDVDVSFAEMKGDDGVGERFARVDGEVPGDDVDVTFASMITCG